jgi:hypothetical protein
MDDVRWFLTFGQENTQLRGYIFCIMGLEIPFDRTADALFKAGSRLPA